MDLDPVLLARLQFAFTITFHIIFPSFTIGLSAYIATLGVLWLRTGSERYHRLMRFWTKIFAVSFAMGVVSGIVLSYQFGTNWSRFSVVAGNMIGPLIGYEVLTAFFLEATFLGILLFGFNRVPPLAVRAVGGGRSRSAPRCRRSGFSSANSWMQTPTGHEMRDGIAYPVDWLADRVQPELPLSPRAHAQRGLSHHRLRRARGRRALPARRHVTSRKRAPCCAWRSGLLAILAPLQLLIGDQHGLNTLKHQPIKIAAMEAHWDGRKPGDFHIFAWPDEKAETNRFAISIPRGSSLVLTHDPNGLFPGLKDVPPQRPPAGAAGVLRLPHHAGDRLLHDRGGAVRRVAVVARHAVRDALVSAHHGADAGGSASSP